MTHTQSPGQDRSWKRRQLLQMAATVTAVRPLRSAIPAAIREDTNPPDSPPDNPVSIIDCNVSLFAWPFRRLPFDELSQLTKRLRGLGVDFAIAGSNEAILHRDLTAVNSRLHDACRHEPMLLPAGAVNPAQPGWQEDLRICTENLNMPGIRLLPTVHGYDLTLPDLRACLFAAASVGRFVQIVLSLEDPRTQPNLFRTGELSIEPLGDLCESIPRLRVQLLNGRLTSGLTSVLRELPGVTVDTARIEGTDGVPRLVNSLAADQVVLGSHAPFLIPEAALIRVHEASLLQPQQVHAVLSANARTFLGGKPLL